MRILVTGGAGFLGSHLIDRLMTEGHEIICLDNFYTGHKRNILQWMNHPNFELIRHDITEPIRLEVDQIYHLACPASPVHYQYNPVKTVKTNVMGTMNMLGLAKRVKARFFLASTSEVYGDPDVHPQTEEYRGNVNPIGLRSCYDEGKRIAETLTFDYHRQNGVDVRVVRIFNTYGPRMLENDGRVVSNFIVQALQGKPLTVYGDGSQTRSFCYVSDLIDGFIRLMNSDYVGPVNIGNPGEYTILQLAEAVRDMVDPTAEINFKPLPSDDPRRRRPDITKAKTLLNWEPTVPLSEGLKLTIDDFRSRMSKSGQVAINR
ncbi:UDP-glucuronic acid decarboxylase family protein [Calothrix sp. NIES-3974]|uniref:UDP-glucuronic acid decarboxylase family protein n=1 Tax=Calothrix sp. NIES-3974 TaxID=2005462 RepID=UPI000B5E2266|nr:UDP-glucuronic acid decarboxylase family protein [Calothrix sp. NIES-3974]BAZ05118.1 NAD-dependent epimerase/dehydratase [Calothrix sp. NIES-3974]